MPRPPHTRFPRRRRSTAGIEAAPGSDIPIASMADDIVFAVNIPEHAPSPGHAAFSIPVRSSSESCPRDHDPTASNMS